MSLFSSFARRRRSPLARLAPVDPADQIRFFTRPPAPSPRITAPERLPVPVPDTLTVGEEFRPDDSACYRLTAVTRPGLPQMVPGEYRVAYGRLSRHGHGGAPRPGPLDTAAATLGDLNEAITRDVARYLPDTGRVEVLTDLAVMGGQVYADGRVVGTFLLYLLKPAKPTIHAVDSPVQEAATTIDGAGETAGPSGGPGDGETR